MVLIDLSQVFISNLMMHISMDKLDAKEINEDMIRHMVLNSIRSYRTKFHADYGEPVICCDDKHSWRKDVFPEYKASRKALRDDSGMDWKSIFDVLTKIKDELRLYMPYKVLQVNGAEADDIIATMCHKFGRYTSNSLLQQAVVHEKVMIVSGDKDFMQLQKYSNIYQYDPVQKKMRTTDNPERFLREHIMLGDRGDGVPNFLSDDDTFVAGKRQKPVSREKLAQWVLQSPEKFCTQEMFRNYLRNNTLVNLDEIPINIRTSILDQFNTQVIASRANILPYFMDKNLKQLTSSIGDF